MPFKPVPTRIDYVHLEHEIQRWWDEHNVMNKYLQRNQDSETRWSFIDGPITANNPMGVHHAWGRSYKDLYNRFQTMQGKKLRYQQGFDCQGLWIEVEVEKELGFKNKHDIETFGVAAFVDACKERVQRFARIMTDQSIRLGYWMDWENSYFTNSDENNYTIWHFLKKCFEKGWIYKGHDTMPWCPRCGTGISQHEIVTEGYQDITHRSVYVKFPLTGRQTSKQANEQRAERADNPGNAAGFIPQTPSPSAGFTPAANESLLVWTTTPWTLAANIAAAVNPELTYVKVKQGDDILYVSQGALATAIRGEHEVIGEVKGAELVGLTYRGPFDELPVQAEVKHRVIAWTEVSDAEGTGIVHIAPGAGAEDFALSKEYGLDVIAPLEEDGTYIKGGGFGFLEGKFAGDVPSEVFDSLKSKSVLYRIQDYKHRYPTCWRCSSELVFRLVDEWYINMDGVIDTATGRTLRDTMMQVTDKATWIPEFGRARELDWLRNMHDWMISKKRYYGLALPIYECKVCDKFEVIGSEVELRARAVEGWSEFEGHSPHRPWVDAVKIACSSCGEPISRITDVGNPWLDAGIVPYSTLNYRHDKEYWREWFPADWVSESFPGQFRNWFYAMIAMSAALEEEEPFKSLFGYALLRDEKGDEMHKSKGNAIWFDDAAEKMGSDVMRWLYLRCNPVNNLNFGYGPGEELKRGFLSTLWNTYSFFVTYASIDGWTPPSDGPTGRRADGQGANAGFNPQFPQNSFNLNQLNQLTELDRWALSELNQLVSTCTEELESYDSMTACRQIEEFVEGLSNWYVRRSRRRFWKSESDADKQAAYYTLWTCLTTLNRLMAPMMPFLAEEMYQNLVRGIDASAAESIHLCDWPSVDESLIDTELSTSVRLVQRIVSLGRAARAKANLKVRQPLGAVYVRTLSQSEIPVVSKFAEQIMEELNVKAVYPVEQASDYFTYKLQPNLQVLGPKYGKELGGIHRALGEADQASVALEVMSGHNVVIGGFELLPDEIQVHSSGKEGYAVAEESGYAVAVSTEITPELADEGLAREIVRHVQELRKSAGFDIADRIHLYHESDTDISRVISTWSDYISAETLATEIAVGNGTGHAVDEDIEGHKVRLSVEKA